MISSKTYDAFLALTRLGIGNSAIILPSTFDWSEIQKLAELHGLSAVVLDGVENLPEDKRPPKEFTLQWIGGVIQNYEHRYEQYCKVIAEMSGFYSNHGIKMMVLKGYGCGLNWPMPNHRPCGDIDIWQFGKLKEADELIAKEKGIKVDTSHHHHTVFYWRDFMVENHFDFINVHHHKSNVELEDILKELGEDDTHSVELLGEKIYLPSPNLNALFLLKHIMMHFAAEGIMLRQVIDWGFFAKVNGKEIDWVWLETILKRFGMVGMYNCLNAICVDDLGFDASVFPLVQFNPDTKDRVLKEIISPEFGVELPSALIKRVFYKIRRWKGSVWKHKLCYNESLWSAFWSGVWNHLLKPSSI